MKKMLLLILAIWAVWALAMLGPRFYWLVTDPDYYGWPAVTKCRVCDKTVWEWQAYERRAIPVEVENGSGLAMSCSMTGLMHVKCKGTPKPAKVTVEPVTQPEWY